MLNAILHFLAPDEKLPSGNTQITIGSEGLSWGWAFLALLLLIGLTWWSYSRFSGSLSRFTRTTLVTLRCVLFAILLLLLVHPVLYLSVEEASRKPLLVLMDVTQSLTLADRRVEPDDLARAALALGDIAPDQGLKQSLPADKLDELASIPRNHLLEELAGNAKLNLWPRLWENSSLVFSGFGRRVTSLGELAPAQGEVLSLSESKSFFHAIQYNDDLTAIGDGLRDTLNDQRGQSLAGILLITDGANNSGSSPLEAAALAKADGVPLFIYGVGITKPKDIFVSELTSPPVSNVKEKLNLVAHIRAQGMTGRKTTVQLKVNGKVVSEQPISFDKDGEQQIPLSYIPDATGPLDLEVVVPPLADEAVKDNNSAGATVNIIDNKVKVLVIEGEPRWDFQFLLAMMQRDRRIKVNAVLLKGDDDLSNTPDSPFLPKIPDDRKTLFAYDLIIIEDVDPNDLGPDRMKLLEEYVSKMGGGILFEAGPKFNPFSYRGTPLDPVFPVDLLGNQGQHSPEETHLQLTSAGEASPMMSLASTDQENLSIWGGFHGVHFITGYAKPRPAAQVLLTAPNVPNPIPVIVQQTYGLGQSLFIGTSETYQWRSHIGEKYYTQLWGQIIQTLTAQHTLSGLTQLQTDKPKYLTGEHIKISGRVFKTGYEPDTDPELAGILSIKAPDQINAITSEVRLQAITGRPGEYEGEAIAQVAGTYTFSLERDHDTKVNCDVVKPQIELSDIAMNEDLLRGMAVAADGHFLREEDLDGLPAMITNQATDAVTLKKIPLSFTPILLGALIFLGSLEWFIRRQSELK